MANFIPEDKVLEIKNAADIVDIVSEVVHLKKSGKNFLGLCPFHSEKTPSFSVSPEKQIYHCFGCGVGGNIFSFLMKHDGLAFPEAARTLARRYGIDIPAQSLTREQRKRIGERESLLNINRQAMDFFGRALRSKSVGVRAMAYLKKRGLSSEIIDRFHLGYAPRGWDHFLNFISKKGAAPALVEKSGLILPKKDKRGYYDRFRDRIIFPILDVNKEVIGFGGRVLDDSLPKYLNSPETPVYNKSRSLYGLYTAKDKCRTTHTIFIVEGYLDLLSLHQNGIENSVATLGTALTEDHVRLLTRYAPRMVLVYDSDEAGIRSALRCVDIFWREHVDFSRGDVFQEEKADTHILVLPNEHDPDSFMIENGPEIFQQVASQAPSIITFLMDQAIGKHGLTTEGKIRVVAEMQQPLSTINDKVARSLYIKQLAERIGIDENIVLEKVREHRSDKSKPESQMPQGVADKASRLEKQIIAMMLQFPAILPAIQKYDVIEYIENDILKSIGTAILENKLSTTEQISELLTSFEEPAQQNLIATLAMIEESWDEKGCLKLIKQFVTTGKKHCDSKIIERIKAAEKENDQEMLDKLLKEKQKLAVQIQKQKQA
ncbi:MAG: DNA primase [Desulfobacterales bacterium]